MDISQNQYSQHTTHSAWSSYKYCLTSCVRTLGKPQLMWQPALRIGICDPVPLNEALWREYRNWEKYFIAMNTFSTHSDAKIDTLWFSYQKLQNFELHKYDIIQNNFTERFGLSKIVFVCTSMGQWSRKCSITPILSSTFSLKKVFFMIVLGMMKT